MIINYRNIETTGCSIVRCICNRPGNGGQAFVKNSTCKRSCIVEVVFDQKLGEVFVIRTAGESLDNAAIASIEYAVDHLGTQLIVVMGHSNCGAVQAALKTPVGGNAGSPYLTALVADLQPRMQSHLKSVHHSEHYLAESWDNSSIMDWKLSFAPVALRTEASRSSSSRRAPIEDCNSFIVESSCGSSFDMNRFFS